MCSEALRIADPAGTTDSPPARPRETACLIIGAGPSGLSLGFELRRRGVDFLIVEQGPVAGHAWHNMPKHTELLSPWRLNCLPGRKAPFWKANRRTYRDEYANYLADYASGEALPILLRTRVEAVRPRAAGGFDVKTALDTLRCRALVNASGYFFNPYTPPYPGAGTTRIPQTHVASYYDCGDVRRLIGADTGRVLVVGKRVSAGQLVVELHDAGFTVAVSCRSGIGFRPHPALARVKELFYFPYEEMLVARNPELRMNSYPDMEGGRSKRLIGTGAVATRPDIAAFEPDEVVFVDGSRAPFDLVIYATGFRPSLGHLNGRLRVDEESGQPRLDDMESVDLPGLYFLGLDNLRNFRSRILRGLRDDAGHLAEKLALRLA